MPTSKTGKTTAEKKSGGAKKASGKRELIDPNDDKRYIRRDEKGRIKESVDQGKSLSQDVKKKAKTQVKSGEGDKGDETKSKSSKK